MSVHYDNLNFYDKVDQQYFWHHWALLSAECPDSFKVSVDKKGKEIHFIEHNLNNKIKGSK